MFEVALYNPRQHKQLRESGSLVLVRGKSETAVWTTVDRRAESANAIVEIVLHSNGISLALAGCEGECDDGQAGTLAGGCQLPLPASFTVGDTRFEILPAGRNAIRRALQKLRDEEQELRNQKAAGVGPSPATLSRWFAALGSLNHWATSLQELYVHAARCAVEAVGLDGGIVLRRRDNEWEIAASHLPHPELGVHYEAAALDELLESPQTLFHGGATGDCSNGPAIVVSPLRNANGELVGAVYGYRSVREGNSRRAIRYLEAHMIELLAGAVSEGIARIEREVETDRRRVLLEQAAATSQGHTVREIAAEEREVSLLFADLRNSTALASALEANEMYELMSQVMECLTAAVIDHDGLIIDYYGDGLAAMWNAPVDQADHAELACRAALRMFQRLPDISTDWSGVLQQELQLGIGVHTGVAHVGNTGSRRRTKYGPRGANVNLTSRIEAATKKLCVPLIVTEATVRRLSNRFTAHRVCCARVPGVDRPIDLYSVYTTESAARFTSAWQAYGEALSLFEDGRLQEAIDVLSTIDTRAHEVPSTFLIECIERDQSREHRRRRSDRETGSPRGIVRLATK